MLFENLDFTPIHSILWTGLHRDGPGRPVVYNPEWDLRALMLRQLEQIPYVARAPAYYVTLDKFVQHGASGVIGTEVSVWEPLAVEVAATFFKEFLMKRLPSEPGGSVGEIILDIRRRLLQKYNPLGLIYTCYCSADLKVEDI